MLVSDLIASSMRLLGAIASGEGPTTTEQTDAFAALNAMLDAWNTQQLLIFTTSRWVFTLTANKGIYTIGQSGTPDLATARPAAIARAGLLLVSTTPSAEFPLHIYTEGEWASVAIKGLQSSLPTGLYYEPDYPNGQVVLWPTPTAANQVALYLDQPLTQFATVGDTVSLAPGYLKAIRYALAVELAPEFGIDAPPVVVQQALLAMQYLKTTNVKLETLRADRSIRGTGGKRFNWITGEYR